MLGNLSLRNNSIFLLMRCAVVWISFGCFYLEGQTALRSENFIILGDTAQPRQIEQGLKRLEMLRAALIALHGPQFTAEAPLYVWIPQNQAAWQRIASRSAEQGWFLSGPRQNWIIINPAAPEWFEVLSHEYVHAVLHHALPNIPTWFEEGICEYYSNLAIPDKIGRVNLVLGRVPSRHATELKGVTQIDVARLKDDYARAWAAAFHLWPGYKAGDALPATTRGGPFAARRVEIDWQPPKYAAIAVNPTAIAELQVELANLLPQLPAPASDAEAKFREGLRLSDLGRNAEAIPLLEAACKERPSNSSWWHALAFAALEAGQLPLGREAIERAIATARNEAERRAAEALKGKF